MLGSRDLAERLRAQQRRLEAQQPSLAAASASPAQPGLAAQAALGGQPPDTTDPLFPTSCLECHALCAPGAAFCPECEFETTHNKPINPATFNPPLVVEPPNPCRDRHWMVTGTTLGLCAWAVCAFFATIEDSDDACTTFETLFSTGYCASFSTGYCTWIIFAVLYANHFAEARISGTRRFIANISDPRQSEDFLQKLTQAPPDMVWESENYHYETRSYTDSDGNTQTRTEKVVTSVVRAKVHVGLSEGQGERDGRAFLDTYASYRHDLSTHACLLQLFVIIVSKVCALAIGTVGNRYFVARQDEYQRRPGCIPAHQTQALQGVCTLASRLPTRKQKAFLTITPGNHVFPLKT